MPINELELERRGFQWSKDTTLDDNATSLLFDEDPNNADEFGSPGERKLYSLLPGATYFEHGTLWLKTKLPNTWVAYTKLKIAKFLTDTYSLNFESIFSILHEKKYRDTVGHTDLSSKGIPWFSAGVPYYGVEDTLEYKLVNGVTYDKVSYLKPSAQSLGDWWLLYFKKGSAFSIIFAACFSLTSGEVGLKITENFSNAKHTIGSSTVPLEGDYYMGWLSADPGGIFPNGSFLIDNFSGTSIRFKLAEQQPTLDNTINFQDRVCGNGFKMRVHSKELTSFEALKNGVDYLLEGDRILRLTNKNSLWVVNYE